MCEMLSSSIHEQVSLHVVTCIIQLNTVHVGIQHAFKNVSEEKTIILKHNSVVVLWRHHCWDILTIRLCNETSGYREYKYYS